MQPSRGAASTVFIFQDGRVAPVLQPGWVRDAFACTRCDAVLFYDGRRTQPKVTRMSDAVSQAEN